MVQMMLKERASINTNVLARLPSYDYRKFFQERNPKYSIIGMYLVRIDNLSIIDATHINVLHSRLMEHKNEDGALELTVAYYACFNEEKEARAWAASVRIGLD